MHTNSLLNYLLYTAALGYSTGLAIAITMAGTSESKPGIENGFRLSCGSKWISATAQVSPMKEQAEVEFSGVQRRLRPATKAQLKANHNYSQIILKFNDEFGGYLKLNRLAGITAEQAEYRAELIQRKGEAAMDLRPCQLSGLSH